MILDKVGVLFPYGLLIFKNPRCKSVNYSGFFYLHIWLHTFFDPNPPGFLWKRPIIKYNHFIAKTPFIWQNYEGGKKNEAEQIIL